MSSTGPAFVIEHVERPYDDVCATLAAWTGDNLWTGDAQHAGVVRRLEHVSKWLARVKIVAADGPDGDPIAEVRVLPVVTGRNPITEVLVVVGSRGEGTTPHTDNMRRARAILDAVSRRLAFGRPNRRAG